MPTPPPDPTAALTDEDIVDRVRAGHTALFEVLMRRYNQRLYRIARAILHSDAEVEDVMQETYLRAFAHLDQFAGRARFATWLTRIAVNEAAARARRAPIPVGIPLVYEIEPQPSEETPEQGAVRGEAQALLDRAIEALSPDDRAVFVLREVEELSTTETAEALGMNEAVVRMRLFRARTRLRLNLHRRTGATTSGAFRLHLSICDRVVRGVLPRLLPGA
ncbi:MAG TPA: RNA polymerase sigma factor [Verrucomicrobiae bacterium]|nr:RNA polymerase sigma factor [Verrucomicrobiae bacterium]